MSDERYVDGPPAGAEGWREVWRDDRRYREGGFFQRLLHKLIRRGGAADRDRQRDFNLVLESRDMETFLILIDSAAVTARDCAAANAATARFKVAVSERLDNGSRP